MCPVALASIRNITVSTPYRYSGSGRREREEREQEEGGGEEVGREAAEWWWRLWREGRERVRQHTSCRAASEQQ